MIFCFEQEHTQEHTCTKLNYCHPEDERIIDRRDPRLPVLRGWPPAMAQVGMATGKISVDTCFMYLNP